MRTTQKRKPIRHRIPTTWCFALSLFLCLNLTAWCQNSTVVIAEVMYDHPLYDNDATKTGYEGEFMSLYNYGEDDIDISGWRIEITDLTAVFQTPYRYTIPANTVLSESGIAVIASRAANSTFSVLQFYNAEMPEEPDGYQVLYTSSLAFPDTRSRIRLYDAQNKLQDELVYDGNSSAVPNEPLLRAPNTVNRNRPLPETVSIQREKIIIEEGQRIISRNDYYIADSQQTVQLFNFLPNDYSYSTPPSILGNPPVTDKLTLSGTISGPKEYKASNIVSSQVIESGKVIYFAEEDITFEPGFEIREGAEFDAIMERDSFHHVKMMTYNLKGDHTSYVLHGVVVKYSKADVVALQEVKWKDNFRLLKEASGYSGDLQMTVGIVQYGIGLLWNPNTVGAPIKKSYKKVKTNDTFWERNRAYMVAEFQDFCFVATHYSQKKEGREKMSRKILNNSLVKECQNEGKPVYIAGDMNEDHSEPAIQGLKNVGFEVLNNIDTLDGKYVDATRQSGSMIDLILGYNKNQYHKTIDRGIYTPAGWRTNWFNEISDHLPYFVRVKVR